MKEVIFLIIFICIIGSVEKTKAQETDQQANSKSETVQLLNKQGVLLLKDFYDIGKVNIPFSSTIFFRNIVITNITTGEKSGALRISINGHIGTLDFDEIEGCIKSITYIKRNIINTIPNNYKEFIYTTKDGLTLGAYINDNKKTKEWMIFIKSQWHINASMNSMNIDKIDEIISMLNNSLDNLRLHLK